jgi:RNase P/RNase MRP subunit p30
MRTFMDMAIRPPVGQPNVKERMAALARQIGLSVICLRFTIETPSSEIESSVRIFRDAGLDVAIGVDISPTSRKQLLNRLRTLRSTFDIVAVKSVDTRTAGIAAHDGRVDLISLEPQKSFRAKQSILKTCKSNLELELSRIIRPLIQSPNESARTIFREVELARRYSVDVVVSSGADNQLGLRAPMDAASLAMTFGLPKESSLDAVSEIPLNIVRRNWDRLSGRSIGPGITLARSQG